MTEDGETWNHHISAIPATRRNDDFRLIRGTLGYAASGAMSGGVSNRGFSHDGIKLNNDM